MAKLLTGTRIYGTGTIDTQLFVSGNNAASSTITGALQVIGGAGVGGNLYVGGAIYGTIVGNITGTATTATQVNTVRQTANASYYPTFVPDNNASAAAELLYTTGSFSINPSTGNVGIGTTSPAYKMDVRGAVAGGNGTITGVISYSTRVEIGAASNHNLGLITNNTTQAVLDTSGNLGLGVTPSAWDTVAYTAMQFPNGGSISGYKGSVVPILNLSSNFYYNSGNKYVITAAATQYSQDQGVHKWYNAPSGTAGAAITFTQAMTLDTSGNLGIGTTVPGARLNVATLETKGQNATVAVFATSTLGSNDFQLILSRGTNAYYALQAVEQGVAYRNLVLQFDGGSVGIGTTAPNTKLDVAGAKNVAAINITQTAPAVANAFDDYVAIDFRMYNEVFPTPQFTGNPSARISSYLESGSNIFGLDFWTRSGAGAFGKVMRLTGAGGLSFGASGTAYGTVGQILQSNGNASPTWINASSIAATTAANIAGGLSGQLLYQSAPSTTTFVSTSTVGNVLVTKGTSAPTFQNTLTLSGTTVSTNTITGAFQVVGGVGIGGNLNVGGNGIITGNAAINGGSLTTNVTTFNLVNTTATTVNFAGAGTTISIGASTGNTTVKNNLVVVGNMTVQGTTTIVDSTVTNISDPIITLGGNAGNTPPAVDDNKDRGVAFKWYDGGVAKVGFFGFQDSTRFFTFYNSATITNEVVAPAGGTTKGALDAYLAGGSAQSLVYQSAPNVTGFLAAGTSGYLLQTNGTGSAPTWVAPSGLTAGNATNATYLLSSDDRIKAPADDNASSLRFGFTSFGNNNSSPYADYLHLRSYTDVTGGNENLVMFRKDVIGMRVWQQAFGTSTAYTSYKDVAFTDSSITGSAAQVNTVRQTANASYFPTFVLDNNATATAESVFTTSSFYINPSNGAIQLNGTGGFNLGQPTPIAFANGQYIKDNGGGGLVSYSGAAMNLNAVSGVTLSPTSTSYAQQSGALLSVNGGSYLNGTLNQGAGYAYLGSHNTNGAYPAFAGTNIAIAWNFTAGNAEMNIWNTVNPTTYTGTGFRFMQQTAAATYRDLMFLRQDGALAFGGQSNVGTVGQVLQSNGAASPTWVAPGGLASGQVNTVRQTASASYYPTFVDANNATATAESFYTTSSFSINPATGAIGVAAVGSGYALSISSTHASTDKLFINMTGAVNSFNIYENSNTAYLNSYAGMSLRVNQLGGSAGLINLSGGNVYVASSLGVGTNTPGAKLDVLSGTEAAGGLQVALTGEAYGPSTTSSRSSIYDVAGTIVRITASNNSTATAALINFNAYNATGGATGVFAGAVSGTTGNGPAHYVIGRRTAAQTWAETFRITQNGGVSFGTAGTAVGTAGQILQSNGDAAPTWVATSAITSGVATSAVNIRTIAQTANASYFPTFVNSNNAANAYELVYTTSSFVINPRTGNVGIGTITPSVTLHVVGQESRFGGVASGFISIYDNSGRVGYIQANGGTDLRIAAEGGTTPMTFLVNGGERARINTTGNVLIGTQTDSGYKLEVNGSFAAVTKSFVINHPTKLGMKLRYGSLEGPENGVYVRGKLTGKNTIELPEYWTKLVDPDSITVSLTSIGKHQDLYVADIANNVVTVGNGNILSKAINCFYVVYGERCDVDKLVVEI